MVGYSSLWEVVGSDLLGTVSGTDLASSHFCFCVMTLLLLQIIQFSFQQSKCLGLILQLGFLGLAVNYNTCGIMGQTHCRVCGINTLPTVSRCSHHVDPDILIINNNINIIIYLRHNCHADCGGMDTSAGFCLRHTLYPVYTAFIFQLGICTLSGNCEADFLHATDSDLIYIQKLCLPSLALCIMYIKPVHFRCKQGSFISAGAGTDFHDNILIIIGILGKQKDLQFLFQLLDSFLGC